MKVRLDKRNVALIIAGLLGTSGVAFVGVRAAGTDTTSTGDRKVSTGFVKLSLKTNDADQFVEDINGMVPGDTRFRIIDVMNEGAELSNIKMIAASVGSSAPNGDIKDRPGTLSTSETGLKVTVEICDSPWKTNSVAKTPSCDGVVSSVFSDRLDRLQNKVIELPYEQDLFMRLAYQLPKEAGNEVAGRTEKITYRFVAEQRAGIVSNR